MIEPVLFNQVTYSWGVFSDFGATTSGGLCAPVLNTMTGETFLYYLMVHLARV